MACGKSRHDAGTMLQIANAREEVGECGIHEGRGVEDLGAEEGGVGRWGCGMGFMERLDLEFVIYIGLVGRQSR